VIGVLLLGSATSAVVASGGKVLGSARHPLNTADFSAFLLQAQASGAKVVALANAGGDMVNATKQADEFGLTRAGKTVVSLLTFITDVNSVGLKAMQGLTFITAFCWDRDDESRAWSKRFFELRKRMPTMAHAAIYSAVRHYLRAIEAAGTDEAKAVMAKMREIPVNDFYAKNERVREDGRMVHDMYFVQVKAPEESNGPWDYYENPVDHSGRSSFSSLDEGGCPLVKQR
jgi:branched-chain amino acid transport system substrate-binding protein